LQVYQVFMADVYSLVFKMGKPSKP